MIPMHQNATDADADEEFEQARRDWHDLAATSEYGARRWEASKGGKPVKGKFDKGKGKSVKGKGKDEGKGRPADPYHRMCDGELSKEEYKAARREWRKNPAVQLEKAEHRARHEKGLQQADGSYQVFSSLRDRLMRDARYAYQPLRSTENPYLRDLANRLLDSGRLANDGLPIALGPGFVIVANMMPCGNAMPVQSEDDPHGVAVYGSSLTSSRQLNLDYLSLVFFLFVAFVAGMLAAMLLRKLINYFKHKRCYAIVEAVTGITVLFKSQAGEKLHLSKTCKGLRNALTRIDEVNLCSFCLNDYRDKLATALRDKDE
jgi:hypothetical protein